MHYKGTHKDVATIARELALDYIVEGGVRRGGDRVALNLQLIRVADQAHVWAKTYDSRVDEVFGIRDRIGRAIADELGQLDSDSTRPVARRPTEDLVAYALYEQGRHHMIKFTPDDFATAKHCFEQAVARDPRFALAYDALAELHWYVGFTGFAPVKEMSAKGMFYALRALEIDNTLAQTHALLGLYRGELEFDKSEMRQALQRALELDPTSPLVKLR